MQVEILEYTSNYETDWDERLLVKHKDNNLTVLTNGDHRQETFFGTVLIPYQTWEIGDNIGGLFKEDFEKITEPLTIKFIPS